MTDPDRRGVESCKAVFRVFRKRPWVTSVRETVQNDEEDAKGYDMFVGIVRPFSKMFRVGGRGSILPVQIKSSERRVKSFIHDYTGRRRFFNKVERNHQFVLCGMDEEELILADIVGQLAVHAFGFGITEEETLKILKGLGDAEAVLSYEKNKMALLHYWYGDRLAVLE